MKYFGPHAEVTLDNISKCYNNKLTCIQFMPGGEYGYNCGGNILKDLIYINPYKIQPVIHATLTCMVCSDKPQVVGATLSYLSQVESELEKYLDYCAKNDCVNFIKFPVPVVVHAGSLKAGASGLEEAVGKFMYHFTKNCKLMTLCIENDVGSKGGTRVGFVSSLVNVIVS